MGTGAAGGQTVLFIVTSYWAYGELAIAMEFAARLPAAGYRPLFLIPPTHRGTASAAGLDHQVLIPGSGKINRIQLADLAHGRPAAVVLADFMNYDFCERHYGLTRADLSVFDCPVGTFDDFAWGRPGSWLDTYGFRSKYQADFTVDGLAFRLRPCPLNSPAAAPEPGVHPYALLDGVAPTGTRHTAPGQLSAIRAEFGLPTTGPLVLLTGATWQKMHRAYPAVTAFVQAWQTMIDRILTRILPDAAVVAVGPRLAFADTTPPEGFHQLPALEPDRFARLAGAVDLLVSNNVVSVTLHRLALGGIPSVTLVNSLYRDEGAVRSLAPAGPKPDAFAGALIDGVPLLYPCRMFPVGWYHFLGSLLADNPFRDVVADLEVFDEDACVDTITALLAPGPHRDLVERARRDYLSALGRLPSVPDVLDRIVEGR